MIKTMQAKYPGLCARTGQPINVGDLIEYNTRTRTARLKDNPARPDTAPPPYLGNKARVSHHFRFSSGGEIYVNKGGRCIDAPCCGCCS